MNKEEIQKNYNLSCAQLGELRFKRHAFDKLIATKLLEIENLEAIYGKLCREEAEGQATENSDESNSGNGV